MSVAFRMFALMALPLALALALSSCALDPFVDEQMTGTVRIAKIAANRQNLLEVCYNASYTTPQAVVALAREECNRRKQGSDVVLLGQTYWQCRLLIPTRAYFRCLPPPDEETPGEITGEITGETPGETAPPVK